MRTLIAIANPKAGQIGKPGIANEIKQKLESHNIQVQLIHTEHQGHATQIAKKYLDEGYRDFICLGGDGTLFEVINGFFQDRFTPIEDLYLGVIPTGTGNSFLRDFTSDIDQIIEAIVQRRTKPSDVIEVIHGIGRLVYINIFSFGFTSEVGMLRNKWFSFAGLQGYNMAVVAKLLNLSSKAYNFVMDGKTIHTDSTFVSMNNTRYTGGKMMMAPNAKVDDGLIDVINVGKMGRMRLLSAFPRIFKGTHIDMPEVTCFKAKQIDFDFKHSIPVMIDGELIHIQPKSMKTISKALKIYA